MKKIFLFFLSIFFFFLIEGEETKSNYPQVVYIVSKTYPKSEITRKPYLLIEYLGAGFVVKSNGIIVSNYNILQNAKEVNVKLSDGSFFPIESFIYYDAKTNICIFKIPAKNLPSVVLGSSTDLKPLDKVYYLSNTLGTPFIFSEGSFSSLEEINNLKWLKITTFQLSRNIGGPVVDSKGKVVGIMGFSEENNPNIVFALAIEEVEKFINNNPKITFKEFVNNINQVEYYLGEVNNLIFKEDYETASYYLKKAIEIEPNYPEIYLSLGRIYLSLNRYSMAKENFQKAKEFYQSRGDYNAIKAIEDFLKLIPKDSP
ncbi:MAG: trypsin-like peptidase domain-containing protein [Candidatus Aenigmatarchaeota archaeon]